MVSVSEVAPGTHRRSEIVVQDPDGGTRAVPVHLLVGSAHRPCLALVAGVHGDEYDGILALHQVLRELEPAALLGSVIVIPVANPFAFDAAQRRTPADNADLNRVFPGRSDGGLSERLAWQLCHEVLQQAGLIFTLHGAGAWSSLSPWVEFQEVPGPLCHASYAAASASGFPDLISLPTPPGVLLSAMATMGIPLIEGEVGGRGTTQPDNVAYYRERVYAVMRHAGVLGPDGQAGHAAIEQRVWHLCYVEAPASGVLLRAVGLKDAVRRGDRLGEIVDIDGTVVATVVAPTDGLVGAHREHAGVRAGDQVFTLWEPAEAPE